jgi:hypothetical protein
MRDDFVQKLERLERHVVDMFEARRLAANATGKEFALTPYTEEPFSIRCESSFPLVRHMVCRAVAARESFRETAPHWAPELPLNSADCEKMISGKSNRIALVGYFGRSWVCANWGSHPTFRHYACGLMACEYTPEHTRNDPELQREYPPRELPGLDQSLCWGIHYRIVDTTTQLMRAEEHWRHCGLSEDAAWIRGILERLVGVTLDPKLQDFLNSQPDRRRTGPAR